MSKPSLCYRQHEARRRMSLNNSSLRRTSDRLAKPANGCYQPPRSRITPATLLHLFNHRPAKSLLKQLSLLSGFRLPRPALSEAGRAGTIFILFAVLGVFASALLTDPYPSAAFWSFWFSVGAALIGALFLKIDKGRLPGETAADLARMAAVKNFGKLARDGAR